MLDVEYDEDMLPKPKFVLDLEERLHNHRSKLDNTISVDDFVESEIAAVEAKLG